ncbi:MAG: formyltetrahydrofolate deformylase [Deltaproteobacteria bacterium]|jgi:formyltetrahydrofolate deformylase|nr:formyltetrahydrofolate deformylase [Deltaproteobacteria bacterium]
MIVLTFSCPDKKGIVAAVSKILFENDANIIESNQYSTNSADNPHFFMRIVFETENLNRLSDINKKLSEFSSAFNAEFKLTDTSVKKKAAVFVSKEDHCLYELLWQKSSGDLFFDVICIVSNHNILLSVAESYGIPFIYAPYRDNRSRQEEFIKKEFKRLNLEIDFVILAKYMRVLSENFINSFCKKIINIHHSFLPSFPGAKPYVQAYQKGVKLVGATAHFVNEKLDDGPIIEQDIIRINHGDDINEIKRKGKIVERLVLAKAVKLFTEDRILEYNNKTIIFE